MEGLPALAGGDQSKGQLGACVNLSEPHCRVGMGRGQLGGGSIHHLGYSLLLSMEGLLAHLCVSGLEVWVEMADLH